MRYPDLPHAKRLDAARVAGTVSRLAMGRDSDWSLEEKLADLWDITDDPQIFGHVLGPYLAPDEPNTGERAAIALLRAAGADEAEAERNAAWQRHERDRQAQGPGFRL